MQLGSPRRLATIYRTNLQSAYMAGRAQIYAEAEGFPYLRYEAVMDAATRPAHAALHGEVFRKDDPIWASIYPPNGYNCRCDVRPLSDGQMQREGFSVSSSRGRVVERWADAGMDKRSGEVFRARQTGIRTTGPDGKPIIMWTDPGFNSSPLAGHAFDELLARKAATALGDDAAFAAVSKAVLSPVRMKAWRGFIENTTATGLVQQQTMTVGILPLAIARQAATAGTPVVPVLHVPDRLVVGKKAARHRESDDALSPSDWQDLPGSLVDAQWYQDTRTGNLVAYRRDSGISVTFSRSGRADSAYRDSAAPEKIRSGIWEPWGGAER